MSNVLKIKAVGLKEVDEDLKRIKKHIGILEKPLRKGLAIVRRAAGKAFTTEGSYGGEKWKPLSPWSQDDRRKHGYGPKHPILKRRGDLRSSWTNKSHPGHYMSVRETSAEMGSMLEVNGYNLMAIHQFGAIISHPKSGKPLIIPARPIFGYYGMLPTEDEIKIRNEIQDFIENVCNG